MNRRVDIKKVYGLYFVFVGFDFAAWLLSGMQGFSFLGSTFGEVEDIAQHLSTAIFIWFIWRVGGFK